MTTPQHDETAEVFEPSPVQIGGSVRIEHPIDVHEQAADFGAYETITIPATTFAQQVLPFGRHRARAYLLCGGTGPVIIGTQAQCQASPPLGYTLATGATLPVMHQQAVWVASAGATATLSVALERWAS